MSLPGALIRKSTGEVIKQGIYPREDMSLIEGLDPDLEWLLIYEPYVMPDYDSRIFVLERNETITTEPHPEYTHLNQYQITYNTVKRSTDDVTLSIKNAESMANEGVFPYTKQLKMLTLGLAILIRKSNGITLTNKELAIENKIVNVAVKMWKNDQILKNKVLQLVAGEEPNIDEGWEKEE